MPARALQGVQVDEGLPLASTGQPHSGEGGGGSSLQGEHTKKRKRGTMRKLTRRKKRRKIKKFREKTQKKAQKKRSASSLAPNPNLKWAERSGPLSRLPPPHRKLPPLRNCPLPRREVVFQIKTG